MPPVHPYNNMNFIVVSEIPGTHIINRAYNATKQIEYLGHAPMGTADSASGWIIRKYVYNVDRQNVTERVAVNAVWDERELLTYE